MILTREMILRELAAGRLAIDPLADDQIGPASIDLHLGDEIRVMESGGGGGLGFFCPPNLLGGPPGPGCCWPAFS